MDANTATINKFYTAFQQLDYATMQQCYSDDAVFNDPVFGLMDADHARAMWEMLCKNAKNFSLVFSNIQLLDEEYATVEWVATYTFSKTGRRVVNKIKAFMRLKDGLIIEHSDAFSMYKWCQQAFGVLGIVLGWTNFFQNKIRKSAKANLVKFMQQD